jgi:uncharacterized protein (TIGR00255 family)
VNHIYNPGVGGKRMHSMTGFGFAEYCDEDYNVSVEIKSYNNRFLDINIVVPSFLNQLEERIRQEISSKIKRGRVELYLKVKYFNEEMEIIIDKKSLHAHVRALQELKNLAGLRDELHLSHLLRIEGLLKTSRTYDREKYGEIIKPVIVRAIDTLVLSRKNEGQKIKQDIIQMLKSIQKEVKKIKKNVPDIEKRINDHVKQRFNELLGKEVDEVRVLAEIAVLLIKFDINEEVMRMQAHIETFLTSIREDELLGKKLDFICQELNREINTISAKSLLIDMNNAAIIIKELIERMREQLRNVE